MTRVLPARAGAATFALAVVLLGGVAGCGASSTRSTTTPSAAAPTSAAPLTTATAPASGCSDVASKGGTVVSTAVRFVGGQVPASDVSAAVQSLESSVASAKAASSGTAAQRLDGVQTAAAGLKTALQAQPVDLKAVGTAAQQLGTALKDLASVCSGGGSTAPTT